MRFRTRVNRAVSKVTGYQLVRTDSKPPVVKPPPTVRKASPPGKKSRPRRAAPRRGLREGLPTDYDQETREIWDAVRKRTMTPHARVHHLIQAVRYIDRYNVPGAIVECGVWRGGSMLAVAHALLRRGAADRDLYLFDTFTGMSEATERDVRIAEGKHADEFLAASGPGPLAWARPANWVATLEDVKEGFADLAYPESRVHFVPGKVEDTVPEHAPERIAILRLDTDWYESTKHELSHLYKRLSPGGVLIIDDYGTWQGSKEATDEFLDETGEALLLTRVARSAVAVKPGLQSVL
jgi:O-methyltransferase